MLILEEVRDPDPGNSEDADPAHRHAVRLAADPVARRDTAPADGGRPRRDPLARRRRAAVRPASRRRGTARSPASRAATSCSPTTAARSWRPTATSSASRSGPRADGRAVPAVARPARGDAVAAVRRSRWRVGSPQPRPRASTRGAPCRPSPCSPTASAGSRCASCSTAIASPPTSCSRPRRTAPLMSASATACSAARRRRRPSSPRPTASATAAPGNVGAGALARIVTDLPITAVTNPLPATGGADPEPTRARPAVRAAGVPHAEARGHRRRLRGVRRAAPEVQKAGATRRWTGQLVHGVHHRRPHRRPPDRRRVRGRVAGVPRPVPARRARHRDRRAAVRAAPARADGLRRARLRAQRRSRRRCSKCSRAARCAAGGAGSSIPTTSRSASRSTSAASSPPRWRSPASSGSRSRPSTATARTPRTELEDRELRLGRLEIARLDNDPNRPENGRIEIEMKGGL